MSLLTTNFHFLLQGLWMTVSLSLATLVVATLLSVIWGVLSTSRFTAVRWTARSLVELFRGLPLIINVFFVYFGVPLFGIDISPFVSIVISLSIWGGANGAEIVRGGLNSVPVHQINSALALSMKSWEILVFIKGPQALKNILPAYVGLTTQIVQSTTLGSLIGVTEFLRVGQNIVDRVSVMDGWNPAFQVYVGVLIVYFIICSLLTAAGRWLEKKTNDDRREQTAAKQNDEQDVFDDAQVKVSP